MNPKLSTLLILALPLLASSCVFSIGGGSGRTTYTSVRRSLSPSDVAHSNRGFLRELEVGMTCEEVIDTMGGEYDASGDLQNPHRIDTYSLADGSVAKVIYFYTDNRHGDGEVTRDELTPTFFIDGRLKGWGEFGFDDWKARTLPKDKN